MSDRRADPNATVSSRGIAAQGHADTALVPGGATLKGAGASASDANDPLIGTIVVERFRLTEKLGAGGMGAVYRGEHIALKKRVAVKFLHREMTSNPEIVERFKREAEIASTLDHPNVAAVIDFGPLPDGTFYLVMEFVEGRSLRQLLETDGKLAPGRALRILRQVGAALARAHREQIVHRDLKPENIIVADREGERDLVKVIDFGIARRQSAGPQLTQLGAVFGTPEYMAPEQAMGQSVDAGADQYALGVIAFELLTGRRPFHADDGIDLLRMHVGAPIPRATEFAPELPPAVDSVLERMLAKRAADRFENVSAAIAALEQTLQGLATAPYAAVPSSGGAVPSSLIAASTGGPSVLSNAWVAPAIATTAPASTSVPSPDRNRKIGFIIAVSGLFVLAIILALATRGATNGTAPSLGAAPDPRPLDQRMFAYQQQPDVAQAMARMYAGDANAAIAPLQARVRSNPRDGLAAYYLGTVFRTARRNTSAIEQFTQAVQLEPALAEDSTLATAAVEALADSGAARSAEALLRGPLSQSHSAARAVADEAIHGSSTAARNSALDIADSMGSLLTALDRARIRLRIARSCDELRAALGGLESMGEGTPREEAAAVRGGACDMLRMGSRCDDCFDDHGHRH